MIDTSSLNWANKDFPKEINEIKYFASVVNDIHNQFNILKNSVELENKQQEVFFKGLTSNSKIFMNEISSFNFNQVEQLNIINISMNFGNLFDLISKIYSDENKLFNDKISILFFEFNQQLTQTIRILIEVLNFPLKDFSYFKNKKIQISEKCEKSYKEIELCINNSKTENYSKEKANEKLIHIFSDFEEKIENFKIIKEEVKQIENIVEELLRSVFYNVMKISFLYINFCESFSQEFIRYKTSFSEKVLNMLTVTIESLGASFTSDGLSDYEFKIYLEKYNAHSEVINYFFSKNNNNEEGVEVLETNSTGSNSRLNSPKIEIKNLPEISENLTNFINCIPHVTNLKKKIFMSFSKFIQEIIRHIETLIQNFTKIQKNVYIFKSVQSTSNSYLLNTSLASKYDFLRNNFDFFLKKNEEILSQKINFNLICNSVEAIIKEITNEENNFVYALLKLNKEYSQYRSTLTKLLIGKEKIVIQIANNKETLMKLEEASQSLTKIEISLENLKSEESKINEQINELNNNYKKYLEDFVENFRKNIFNEYKERDSIRFREQFQDIMLNILNLFERAFSGVYLRLRDENLFIKEKSYEKNIFLKQDLNTIFGLFKEGYLKSLRGRCMYDEVLNMILSDSFVDDVTSTGNIEVLNLSYDKENLENSVCFISKDDPNRFSNVDALNLTNILKEDDINALRENNKLLKAKIKVNKKSSIVKTVDIKQLYNLVRINDEAVYKTFYCSYQTGLSLLIPGILFVTNKRIVFQPFINMKKFLLINKKENSGNNNNTNRTIINYIEFFKDDLISIKEKDNFMERIEIKTITEEFIFLFLSFALAKYESNTNFKYIENVLISIKESFMINDLNNIPESLIVENKKNELLGLTPDERISSHINLKMISNPNFAQPQEGHEFHSTLTNLNFFKRVNDFQKSQLDFFTENNRIRVKFNETFVKDKPLLLGKSTDSYIPIQLIYKYIYDNQVKCCHDDYNKAKTFILNLKEIRKDYNISFNKLSHTAENIPKYYSDPFDYTGQLFSANINSENSLKEFLDTMKENFGVVLEYEYNYTHPMKKKFMGPSKLDMNDKYKIIFLSPLCFIVEISTFMSGFMLMDTFYTVAQYKYEADLYYDPNLKRIAWKTMVNASFAFEFVKDCWFRNKIESNGLVENEEYMRDFVLVHFVKVLEERSQEYYNIINRKKEEHAKHDYSLLNSSAELNASIQAAASDNNKEEILAKENILIEPYQNGESRLKSEDYLISGTSSKDNVLDSNKLLTRNNLLLMLLIFSVIFITTVILSFVFPQFYLLKDLILCLILSINTVLLYKLSEKVSDIQKRINTIGSK